jgi:hypothetical protein
LISAFSVGVLNSAGVPPVSVNPLSRDLSTATIVAQDAITSSGLAVEPACVSRAASESRPFSGPRCRSVRNGCPNCPARYSMKEYAAP